MNPLRIFARIHASVGGYFWLPCPVCKRMFGGHEFKPGRTPLIEVQGEGFQRGRCVCSDECSAKAWDLNEANGFYNLRRI